MRRAWLALSAATLLLAGCSASSAPAPSPSVDNSVKSGTLGTPVTRDGIFEYTVTSLDCAEKLCTVGITISNLSGTARKPGISFAKLYDSSGTAYLADALAEVRGNSLLLDDLAAGTDIADHLYYDVPAGVSVTSLELREEPSSPGIRIDVSGRRTA